MSDLVGVSDWRQLAACRGHDPELWFPTPGQSADLAVDICRGCRVLAQCGAYAKSHRDVQGIWAGQRLLANVANSRYRSPMAYAERKPHGTLAAVRRHHRRGEPQCEACRQASKEYAQTKRDAIERRATR